MSITTFFVIAFTVLRPDSLVIDSAKPDSTSLPKEKGALDAPVTYEANDSVVFNQDSSLSLFGNGKVNYQQIELTSESSQ